MVRFVETYNINIFIAHSRDVAEERSAIEDTIASVNRALGPALGCRLERFWWKHERPGAGRPQSTLNRRVDECDIFLGIVGKGWGTPPHTDSFSSGFEEEYTRALERWKESGAPEIWLFLKELQEGEKSDAGEKMLKNLAFRKHLTETGEVLYKLYVDTSDLKEQVHEFLSEHVARMFFNLTEKSQASIESEIAPEKPAVETPSSEPSLAAAKCLNFFPPALIETVNKLHRVITSSEPDLYGEHAFPRRRFEMSRLLLLVSSWFARYHSDQLMTSHQINLLYLDREQLEFSPEESDFVFRTLLGNPYAPGWYWYRDFDENKVMRTLFWHAAKDGDDSVRLGALDRLTQGKIHYSEIPEVKAQTLSGILHHPTAEVRQRAIGYLQRVATLKDLKELLPYLENDQYFSDSSVRKLSAIITIREDPDLGFKLIADNLTDMPADIASLLREKINAVSDEILENATEHENETLASVAVEELIGRGRLETDRLRQLADEARSGVVRVCLKALLARGETITPDDIHDKLTRRLDGLAKYLGYANTDDLVYLSLSAYKPHQLEQLLGWVSRDGLTAYKVLANRHFSLVAERIRGDLDDEFQKLEQAWLAAFQEEAVSEAWAELESSIPEEKRSDPLVQFLKDQVKERTSKSVAGAVPNDVTGFLRSRYIAVVLEALAQHGSSSDIAYGRKYLSHTSFDVRVQALGLMERFAEQSDLAALLNVAKTASELDIRRAAGKIALELSPGVSGAAATLLDSDDPLVVSDAIAKFGESPTPEMDTLVEPLLMHPEHLVRRDAFIYFQKTKSREYLEALLSRYLSKQSYYYEVVCWLDRYLYYPKIHIPPQ